MIKRISVVLFFCCVFLLLLALWLVSSESGLKTLVYGIKPLIPGTLNIEKISGTLRKTIVLEDIEYHGHQMVVRAEKLTLTGKWGQLRNKDINLKYFSLENARLILMSTQPEKTLHISKATGKFELFNRENHLQFQVQQLEGNYNHQPIQIQGGIKFNQGMLGFQNTSIEWGTHTITIQPKATESNSVFWHYKGPIEKKDKYGNQLNAEMIQAQGDAVMRPGSLSIDSTVMMDKKRVLSFSGSITLEDFLKMALPEQGEGLAQQPNTVSIKPWAEQKIQGKFQIELLDLSPIYHYVPDIARIKAKPVLKAEMTGTLLKPRVTLNGDVGTAVFSIPKQRITIKQFQLRIAGDWNKDLTVLSSGTTGDNPFYIQGSWNPFKEGMPGTFQLTGKALRIFNTANIRIVVSPTLSLKYDAKMLALEGTVEVDEGDIVLKKELNSVIVSNDVIYMGHKIVDLHPESIQIKPQIQLIIKDNFHFKGYGLDANVGGKLYIEQRKDKLYTGQGRIILREGKYRLPNGTGNIHRGYLYYPPGTLLHDPVLDIRVLQRARDKLNENGDVGVYVQGSLQKPVYHLYSSEPLKQNEILSKLGCGGTQFEGEDNQRKMLSQTAVLLGGGVNPVLENIQTKFGLEEFGIQSGNASKYIATQEGNDATLVVGKALSERIYLQFMQGMLVPSSTLKLQYFLTPYVAISGETSTTGLGGDISFSVEKD